MKKSVEKQQTSCNAQSSGIYINRVLVKIYEHVTKHKVTSQLLEELFSYKAIDPIFCRDIDVPHHYLKAVYIDDDKSKSRTRFEGEGCWFDLKQFGTWRRLIARSTVSDERKALSFIVEDCLLDSLVEKLEVAVCESSSERIIQMPKARHSYRLHLGKFIVVKLQPLELVPSIRLISVPVDVQSKRKLVKTGSSAKVTCLDVEASSAEAETLISNEPKAKGIPRRLPNIDFGEEGTMMDLEF